MASKFTNYFRELDETLSRAFAPVVKWLVYSSVLVFLIHIFVATFTHGGYAASLIYWMGASVSETIFKGRIWQLLTYAFVHGHFVHLLFNLLAVYFFGNRLESRWGSATFFRFCVVVIAGSVLFHLLVSAAAGQSGSIIIGMSGLVYGILLVYAIYYPDDIVYVYGVFPIKVKYFVAVLGLLAFMSSTGGGGGSGVAHLTHFGGLLVGYGFMRFSNLFDWIWVPPPFRPRPRHYTDPWW